MSMVKTYNPAPIEKKWYEHWHTKGFFRSIPDQRTPYTIAMPPPNVTGVLHMGHMLNNTIQDVLIRRARMLGKNACWVPGTDHASIATEAKVVALLKERGIEKSSITREEFLEHAWEWKNKYGDIILDQLKKLGASCDWERTRFTMDDDLSDAVIDTFVELYRKGFIYRGVRMVNWDSKGKTAVSDEEVIYKEVNSHLYYVNYPIVGEVNQFITIATTRPETIPADTAICVHPADERYRHLQGKKATVPFTDREIPIIYDAYIDKDFGTGCLKVTPAHSLQDYELGLKHQLEVIDILNDDGTLNENAQVLVGEDRFVARKKIANMLEEAGLLVKVEPYQSQVGFSERTDAVIEPKLSMQWFCKMQDMAKPALDYVINGDIRLIPDKFINTYRHWMENTKDWCISRQLWWGHRIPAWYLPNGNYVVAKTAEQALEQAQHINKSWNLVDLRQDDDVLDTWFSSWLWPISIFDGFKNPQNADINYYYPTNDLVTAPEILFFWVARMIMAGHEFKQMPPFKNVYLTGIVRDKQGRKMSKSLGNSPDPIELIDRYGADGVRVGMLLCSPAGNDLMFDESHCEQGRNFANKIWNAFRLVKSWEVDSQLDAVNNRLAVSWFRANLGHTLQQINTYFEQYKLSDALMATYKLVWDEFCSWYLEWIKPAYQQPIDAVTHRATIDFFAEILKILHPFMPFITEELWHDELFGKRLEKDCCIVATWPIMQSTDARLLTEIEVVKVLVSEIRNSRNAKQISPKQILPLAIKQNSGIDFNAYVATIQKLAHVSEVTFVQQAVPHAVSFLVGTDEFFVTMGDLLDVEVEQERVQKEIIYLQGFLKSVNAKLSNEKFMQNAKPEVIANEQQKQADALTKLQALEKLV